MSENKDCSQHRRDVFGQTDMKIVAAEICDMHYETLAQLFFEMQTKLHNDSIGDLKLTRFKLFHRLHRASKRLYEASNEIESAWQISKKFMQP